MRAHRLLPLSKGVPPARVPRLMAIADFEERRRAGESHAALSTWVRLLEEAGIDALQIREKGGAAGPPDDRRVLADLRLALAAAVRLRVLVNGRPDLALAAGAAGVHLPSAGLPVAAVRARWPGLLVGVSTHHPHEVKEALLQGADYATFGPVFETPSKAAYGPPPGLAGLARAARQGLPVLGLGGIGPAAIPELAEAGAHGAAAIRAFLPGLGLVEMVDAACRAWPTPAGPSRPRAR